jgi:hypothetical protein
MRNIEAINQVLKVVDENREELLKGYHAQDAIQKLILEKELAELEQLFQVEIKDGYNTDWIDMGDNQRIGLFFGNTGRNISWPDADYNLSEEEYVYVVSFPTGAYIFGGYMDDKYPVKTFSKFFNELKALGAKYVDSHNHCLYFPPEKAKLVRDKYTELFNKYKSQVEDEMKEQRKQKLQEELDKLNSED